jgi:hypothetical protein
MAALLFFFACRQQCHQNRQRFAFSQPLRDNSAPLRLSFGRARRQRRNSHLFSLRIEVFAFADDSWFTRFHYFKPNY